jgi:uncharacterized protein (UPF0261 family)
MQSKNTETVDTPLAFRGEGMKRIFVAGTADTKGEALACLAGRVRAAGGDPCELRQTGRRRLIRLPLHINDPKHSAALAEDFR